MICVAVTYIIQQGHEAGCRKDSAGKFCPDIMSASAIANGQTERGDAWAEVEVQELSAAASDGCEPG